MISPPPSKTKEELENEFPKNIVLKINRELRDKIISIYLQIGQKENLSNPSIVEKCVFFTESFLNLLLKQGEAPESFNDLLQTLFLTWKLGKDKDK